MDEHTNISAKPGGMRKSFWFAITAVIALVVMFIGGTVYAVTAVRASNEARAEVVEAYEAALSAKGQAVQQLTNAITEGESTLASVGEDQVADAGTLENLLRQVKYAEKTVEETDTAPQDLAGMSNEEVTQLTTAVESDRQGVLIVTDTLAERVKEVQDSVAAKEKADEEARKAAEAAEEAAALAAAKAAAQPITYEDLFRAGDTLVGQHFTFQGKIIQDAGKSGDSATFRVNITADQGYSRVFWQDTVLLYVTGETAQKLLEDDIVSFTATSVGLTSYKSIMGATIELPALMTDGADITITGRDG